MPARGQRLQDRAGTPGLASLVDGATGANVWAERYEGAVDDIFHFQDEVLEQLVRVLSVRLSRAERERLGIRGTESVEAHDAYLRGRQLENLYTRETNLEAERALKVALRRDPDFALAHAHLSQVSSFRVENGWTPEPDRYIAEAFTAAEPAIAPDPSDVDAHVFPASVHIFAGQVAEYRRVYAESLRKAGLPDG